MAAFSEKIGQGKFKTTQNWVFFRNGHFWAHLLGYLHDSSKILDFKKAKKVNIEHKACINYCVIKVAFI